jgi:hypothetical protein
MYVVTPNRLLACMPTKISVTLRLIIAVVKCQVLNV